MNKQSNLATSFVAVAHYVGPADEAFVKSAAFSPTSTIQDVFAAFWPTPDDYIAQAFAGHKGNLPFRIEILPDVKTIPAAEKLTPL
ncbi:MAG: hypothetical protein EOR97_05295 [Mesorhizobium sp.]|uniref:hypothetical protein n=1 Tax=Mesorhizobium sp. TaxID=1871066 RepID=UPI000FE9252D|nr:hypothetical protein [Mesorhizobium sp.]RWN34172.1 MAG: hypothetical protein EOR97_05295 [Mesorhizobium sp.]